MKPLSQLSNLALVAATLCVAACRGPGFCPEPPPPVELGSFPYHPLAYHLDLSILSYQLHGQSLVWPFDPYYEDRAVTQWTERDKFMQRVHDWAQMQGEQQVSAPGGLFDVRGPGALVGLANDRDLDPILYDYSRIHPWSNTVMNGAGTWTEYLTPREITGRIRDVYVAYRPIGGAPGDVTIDPVAPGNADADADADADATDILIAFEGETGNKGEPGMAGTQSLMGFVLVRHTGDSDYDVHVTFRGSRSGKGNRAFLEAISTHDAGGNPDWVTDLGWNDLSDPERLGITSVGQVSRGIGTSMLSMLPAIFTSLEMVADLESGPPTNIYVTGHSLGGGLGQHFTSAVLLGNQYGPSGAGDAMPASLLDWPWAQIKLITFSAPRSGDAKWAEILTTTGLDSEFFDKGAYDRDALPSTAAQIVPRVLNPDRPAGYRALISTDPITTGLLPGGRPVGKTVYVNKECEPIVGLPDAGSHEPEAVREYILAATGDPTTPPDVWNYLDMEDLNPTRDDDEAGSVAEFEKLRDAVLDYYADTEQWFDDDGFLEYFELMLTLD